MHVSFVSMSDGSSNYTTDNSDIQYGIERHYQFGKLFRLSAIEEETAPVVEEAPAVEKEEKRVVKVSDLAMAKDFLADTFGVSRTALRSEKSILEQAAMHGVEFTGI